MPGFFVCGRPSASFVADGIAMDPLFRWKQNPFFILGLEPSASNLEVERMGRKLLGQLELGLQAARFVETPLGRIERSADDVRRALAELRDPRKRAGHELWAGIEREELAETDPKESESAPWKEAMRALGWKGLSA